MKKLSEILPDISASVLREAGMPTLADVARQPARDITRLRGIGPKAILCAAIAEANLDAHPSWEVEQAASLSPAIGLITDLRQSLDKTSRALQRAERELRDLERLVRQLISPKTKDVA